jgi:hypothetical protein
MAKILIDPKLMAQENSTLDGKGATHNLELVPINPTRSYQRTTSSNAL